MKIIELHYCPTNTYLIEGEGGRLLIDTGWAGTLPVFCSALGALGIPVQSIDRLVITHFHPDHMGIAQEIADMGPVITVMDVQRDYVHAADPVFEKEKKKTFVPIRDDKTEILPLAQSRAFLSGLGLQGEILHTPGHSDDSISLWLDEGLLFVGDLNPLYERELHKGTLIDRTWERLLARGPKAVYYGHAKPAFLSGKKKEKPDVMTSKKETEKLVETIVKLIDRNKTKDQIMKKTGADPVLIEDVTRMYLTHPGVSIMGILDRIEIKGR